VEVRDDERVGSGQVDGAVPRLEGHTNRWSFDGKSLTEPLWRDPRERFHPVYTGEVNTCLPI
jgi:hypothetical protein